MRGTPGKKGIPGLIGPPGVNGTDGTPGATGRPGKPAIPGIPGARGLPGKEGDPGARGLPGKMGKSALPGRMGLPGKRMCVECSGIVCHFLRVCMLDDQTDVIRHLGVSLMEAMHRIYHKYSPWVAMHATQGLNTYTAWLTCQPVCLHNSLSALQPGLPPCKYSTVTKVSGYKADVHS